MRGASTFAVVGLVAVMLVGALAPTASAAFEVRPQKVRLLFGGRSTGDEKVHFDANIVITSETTTIDPAHERLEICLTLGFEHSCGDAFYRVEILPGELSPTHHGFALNHAGKERTGLEKFSIRTEVGSRLTFDDRRVTLPIADYSTTHVRLVIGDDDSGQVPIPMVRVGNGWASN